MARQHRPRGTAFLLSQLGSLGATQFAERLTALDLTPPEAGVLRLLAREDGISQRALAERLGTVPSRVVTLLDQLQGKDLVERTRSAADRRNHELRLTDAGRGALRRIRTVAEAHEEALTDGLTAAERETLQRLLARLAQAQGLDPDVHPGYRQR